MVLLGLYKECNMTINIVSNKFKSAMCVERFIYLYFVLEMYRLDFVIQ